MRLVTVDLDDTLMYTGRDYVNAREQFGAFMEQEYGFDAEEMVSLSKQVSREKLDDYGLTLERFPTAFELTLKWQVDNPEDRHVEHVRSLARSAYKSRDDYASRGYMPGAREMLDLLASNADALHLITAGVESLQRRKVEGLRLEPTFDECHVVGMNKKADTLVSLQEEYNIPMSNVFHVGNSETSDVEPALSVGANAVHVVGHQWRGSDIVDENESDRMWRFEETKAFNEAIRDGFFEEAEHASRNEAACPSP